MKNSLLNIGDKISYYLSPSSCVFGKVIKVDCNNNAIIAWENEDRLIDYHLSAIDFCTSYRLFKA